MADRTRAPAGAVVVARRWDGLGGRLHALLNAWSIARALNLEFRFVWPRNAFAALRDPRELFDDAFLARFEIPEAACADRVALPDPTASSLLEARERCRAAAPFSMIDVAECFDVAAFAGEPAGEAGGRFRAGLGEIGWSGAVHELLGSAWGSLEYSAVHARAGDIVDGAWRQFVPVEKYVPTAYVEHAVEARGVRPRPEGAVRARPLAGRPRPRVRGPERRAAGARRRPRPVAGPARLRVAHERVQPAGRPPG